MRVLILPCCVALAGAYLPSPHARGMRRRRSYHRRHFPSLLCKDTEQHPQPLQRLQSNREDNSNDVQSLMRALGTSPRRIFLSILSGTAIALTGNFLGITSTLLTTISEETGRLNVKGVSESGDTNVSVIVTDGMDNFSLTTLGGPIEAANKLLQLSIAPTGSGRTATLICAIEDTSRKVYQLEFNVDRSLRGAPIKNISVIAATPQGDKLITLTVVAPLQLWETDAVLDRKCRKIASSFHVTTTL